MTTDGLRALGSKSVPYEKQKLFRLHRTHETPFTPACFCFMSNIGIGGVPGRRGFASGRRHDGTRGSHASVGF